MHGRKAYELVKEFADGEKGHLKIFNVRLLACSFYFVEISFNCTFEISFNCTFKMLQG